MNMINSYYFYEEFEHRREQDKFLLEQSKKSKKYNRWTQIEKLKGR